MMMMLLEKMNQVQQHQQQPGTALLYNAAGQPVAVALPPQPSPYQSYKKGQSMIAGIILLIAGVLSIAFTGIGISLGEVLTFGGTGIWIGIMVSRVICELYFYACLILSHSADNCTLYYKLCLKKYILLFLQYFY